MSNPFTFTGKVALTERFIQFCKDTRGTTAIEISFLLPIFMVIVLGMVQVSDVVLKNGMMKDALQNVARQAMVDPDFSVANIKTKIANELRPFGFSSLQVTAPSPVDNQDGTETLSIKIDYGYVFHVPMAFSKEIQLSASTSFLRFVKTN